MNQLRVFSLIIIALFGSLALNLGSHGPLDLQFRRIEAMFGVLQDLVTELDDLEVVVVLEVAEDRVHQRGYLLVVALLVDLPRTIEGHNVLEGLKRLSNIALLEQFHSNGFLSP